jgi:hypothetical protein
MEYDVRPDESVSTAVVRAVSAVDGREPRSMPPLVETVDPDALNRLFAKRENGEPRTGGQLSFVYGPCRVTVDNGEYLTVEPLGDGLQDANDRSGPDQRADR